MANERQTWMHIRCIYIYIYTASVAGGFISSEETYEFQLNNGEDKSEKVKVTTKCYVEYNDT